MESEVKTVTVDVADAFAIKSDTGELCRLCANTDNQLMPIFRGEGLEHSIATKIEKYLPIINVTELDKLPLQICYQCASTLIAWNNLYEGCRVADKRLREILCIDDKLYPEDETFEDYVDDYRDNYDEQTHNIPTPTPSTSNLESNILRPDATDITQLNDAKTFNETELDSTDERRLAETTKYCLTEVSENTIDRFIYSVYSVVDETDEAKAKVDETYLCTICGEKFISDVDLMTHTASVHDQSIGYACDVCNREFKSKNRLSSHIRSDHQVSKDPITRLPNGKYQCPICEKVFCRKPNANQHFMSHVAEKSMKCEKCEFRCHTQTQLEAHKKKHEKRFCCEICSKMFAYKFQLEIHVQGVHYNLRPFTCKLCSKTFKTKYNFGSHMAQHKDIRNFHCPFCPRRCRKSYDLRIHIRTHTGEKPFQCTYCQRAYSQNGDRLKHEKHCSQKVNATQVLLVERYPDNEITELTPAKDTGLEVMAGEN